MRIKLIPFNKSDSNVFVYLKSEPCFRYKNYLLNLCLRFENLVWLFSIGNAGFKGSLKRFILYKQNL